MDVAQLFDALLLAPHVEIVKSRLPETCWQALAANESGLLRIPRLRAAEQTPRHGLFDSLDGHRKVLLLRLANQQMDMFRHGHISEDEQFVLRADVLQETEEKVPAPCRSQQRQTTIAAERDEMEVAQSVVSV